MTEDEEDVLTVAFLDVQYVLGKVMKRCQEKKSSLENDEMEVLLE